MAPSSNHNDDMSDNSSDDENNGSTIHDDVIDDEETNFVLTSSRAQLQSHSQADKEGETETTNRWTAERLWQASYKDLGSPAVVEERFLRHLLNNCQSSIENLLRESSTTTKDYSITIDAFDFLQADPVLGHLTLRYPATLLPLLEAAVVRAQRVCLQRKLQNEEQGNNENDESQSWRVKGEKSGGDLTRVHARLVHLPPTHHNHTHLGNILQAANVGRMVQVTGTVVRCSPVQMYESARTWKCQDCQATTVVAADVEQRHNALQPPTQCRQPRKDANSICRGTKFKIVPDGSIHTDYQEIKIQETTSHHTTPSTGAGQIPRSLLVKVQHDLVDSCQPGDQVIVVGSLLAQWPASVPLIPDTDCPVDMAMMAHSVRVVDDQQQQSTSVSGSADWEQYQQEFDNYWKIDEKNIAKPIQARDFIAQAVCPKLYGMAVIKLALLVTLIGGVSSEAYHAYSSQEDGQDDNYGRNSNYTCVTPCKRGRSSDDTDHHPDPFVLPSHPDRRAGASATAWNHGNDHSSSQFSPGFPNASRHRRGTKARRVQTRRRDQSHLLLVGDPGVGKSQFLKFAAAVSPRSVLTTGVGTTSAGLTCAAVREGNTKEFSLEAGALVLADKGVCCIDEFGCIQDQDRTTIHEAMEQQTLSVAKAGIVCKLNCRATIIAVMNPRDCIYDNQVSLSVNTGLGTPLLSRFDLIFKLVDAADAERDNNVTMYLLNRAIQGAGMDVGATNDKKGSKVNQPWSMDKLRAYIAVVKERFQPVMSDEAAMLLEAHYEKCRSCQSHTIPVTVRFLESLIRLSQAHARLMYRDRVTIQDAVAVVQLMESSAFAYGGFDGSGSNVENYDDIMYRDPMTVDFSDEADADLACFEYRLLTRYNMLAFMPSERQEIASRAIACHSQLHGSGWDAFEDVRGRH